jgi:prevent-host-death family protein
MSSPPKSISTGAFKSRCLAVIDEVMRTRQPVLVTKRGGPVAKVIPTEKRRSTKLLGTVKFHGDIIEPILGNWDIEQ